jgi:TolB-like protein/DNA-binding winged helix-turn-helix (wHTH) protein
VIAPPSAAYEFGDFRLEVDERRLLRRDGTAVPLTPRVFATLRYLVENSGRVLPKDELMGAVWPDCVVEENNLVQNISTLRRAFGDSAGAQRYIVTVPGRGYRFVPEVQTVDERGESSAPELTSSAGSRGPRGYAVVAVLALLAIAALVWRETRIIAPPRHVVTSAGEKSIAVLPFENLSGDPENAYFADGVKDEILTRLSKIAALKVISRTSTQKFKSAPENVREIAQQLGVAHLLEGSVQKSGDIVRVTVQLIHAQSDTHLWAETYDRRLTDMFQVESDIAQRVAASLEAALTGSETRSLEARPTVNVAAREAYLKGRYFWNKRTSDGYRRAVEFFERAVALDPGYAQAYAGLADALQFLSAETPPRQSEALARSRAALQRALELDDTLAEAHASRGLVAMNFDWDWNEAEREFRRAIELDPNYATAHQWYGEFLANMGRFEEGIAEMQRARELDPLSIIINSDVAKVYITARRYDEAVEQFKRTLEMDPTFGQAHGLLGVTYSLQGRHEEAIAELRSIAGIERDPLFLSWLGYVYGAAGRETEARAVVDRLLELAKETSVSPVLPTFVYAGLGDNDSAFEWFDRVFDEHAAWGAVPLKASPLYDRLRADPRFASLLSRANFPQR